MAEYKIIPKKENENISYHYTVTKEQIEWYKKFSIEEKLRWIELTNMFISALQTPEENARMRQKKDKFVEPKL